MRVLTFKTKEIRWVYSTDFRTSGATGLTSGRWTWSGSGVSVSVFG